MCVIIHKPKGVELSRKDAIDAFKANPDGFGYMYFDEEKQEIITDKSIKYTAETAADIVESLKDVEAVFHWRIKTHGAIADAQCHPFNVTSKKDTKMDMFMMHNGTISKSVSDIDKESDENDTQAFVRTILQPLLTLKPTLIRTQAMQRVMSEWIGFSKLTFMYGKGEVMIVNREKGSDYKGCWASNLNFTYRSRSTWSGGSCQSGNYRGDWNKPLNNKSKTIDTKKKTGTDIFTGTKVSTSECAGMPFDKDSIMWVYSENDPLMAEEGKITAIYHNSVLVSFKKAGAQYPTSHMFCLKTGRMLSSQLYPGNKADYQIIPESQYTNNLTQSFKDRMAEDKTSNAKVIDLTKKRKEEDEQVSKKKSTTKSESSYEVDDDGYVVFYNGVEVDPEARWGVEGFRDCYSATYLITEDFDAIDNFDEYMEGDVFSIYEFSEMSEQDRFAFFMTNKEAAFNMLQDAVEVLSYMDNSDYAATQGGYN